MLLAVLAVAYGAGLLYGVFGRTIERGAYLAPEAVRGEIEAIARDHADVCQLVEIGRSTEGRPILALRLSRGERRARLLVTANIHAVEYIASSVARALARQLARGAEAHAQAILERAEVWIVPLLNPDGAERVWRTGGRGGIGAQRFTANGVDPNRNFPAAPHRGHAGMRTASARPGSAYYRGPHPLSENECLALARLAKRQRFCAAIHFHSFGGVVFMPAIEGADEEQARHRYAVFDGVFQARQKVKYRPVLEPSQKIAGQLDAFLYDAFGTVSVTVEVSRLDRRMLKPWRLANLFWWANPEDPRPWIDNDVDASLAALAELLDRSGGEPCTPPCPQLADEV